MTKENIRNKIRLLRNSFNKDDLQNKSLKITNLFYHKYSSLNTFLLYYPIENEVDTIPLINKLFFAGKEIYLPVINNNNMIFRQFMGFDNLVLGKYNIYEPQGKKLDKKPDIICIPGVAFDKECNRIGYGGGYYDKYLSKINNVVKVAFAYEFQIIDKVETESFDEPVDEIFTENIIIRRT